LLPALERIELPLTAHLQGALAESDWAEVGSLCELAHALKTTREIREAGERVGRQRVELLARLHPDSLAPEFLRRAEQQAWPHNPAVAAAMGGQVLGVPLGAVLGGIVYTTLSGQL